MTRVKTINTRPVLKSLTRYHRRKQAIIPAAFALADRRRIEPHAIMIISGRAISVRRHRRRFHRNGRTTSRWHFRDFRPVPIAIHVAPDKHFLASRVWSMPRIAAGQRPNAAICVV